MEQIHLVYTRPKKINEYTLQKQFIDSPHRFTFVEATAKAGKAQPLDAKIKTPKGEIKMCDIKKGTQVYTGKGIDTVVYTHPQGVKEVYRVTFSDGSSTECTLDHLWEVHYDRKYKGRGKHKGRPDLITQKTRKDKIGWPRVLALAEILKFQPSKRKYLYIPLTEPIERRKKEYSIPPYLMGVSICDKDKAAYDKFIPDAYKQGSISQRIELLQGIFDTDGYVDKHGQAAIECTSEVLISDILEIVESLGGTGKRGKKKNKYKGKDGKVIPARDVYRLTVHLDNYERLFTLKRKIEKCRAKAKPARRSFMDIQFIGKKQCQCIELHKPGTYLTDNHIVTHNTVGCLVWLYEQAISPYGWFYPDPIGIGVTSYNNEKIVDKAGYNYWWVAPSYTVAKIAYRRLKRYISDRKLFIANESELSITLPNGAMIFFKGADKPDSLYGEDVYAVVVDEASRTKREAFTAIISTLTATKGLFKAIGNVKGKNNWFYEKAHEAKEGKNPDAAYYLITAKDAVAAGVLDQKVIDQAEKQLAKADFLELYHGIPNLAAANQYAYSFNIEKHVKSCEVDLRFEVWLSFDFNVDPISAVVIQHIDGVVKIPEVLQLSNSNIYELCKLIKTKYPTAVLRITGDATGKGTSAMTRDNLNYFRIIRRELKIPRSRMNQKDRNPPTDQNRVLVNAVLEHIPHQIDPDGASALIDDFLMAQVGPDGKLLKKDRNKDSQKLEALDGYRYWVNTTMQGQIKNHRHI